MTVKYAICQVADTSPLESLAVMLRSVGIEPLIPTGPLKAELRSLGCDTVLDIAGLVSGMGYDPPFKLTEAGVGDMTRRDILYIDVKGHRNGPKVWKKWPHLENRTLWYRINGAQPEHVIKSNGEDCGDEINPPCPVLTPNQWYKTDDRGYWLAEDIVAYGHGPDHRPDWYAFWPPFHRFHEYQSPRCNARYESPICLIHRVQGWGYDKLIDPFREQLGVRMHGVGCADGLINHREVPTLLSRVLCMVHLKSNDAPGYALYEAMAAACPIVCTRRLIWRSKMQDLLIPGETCLVFDQETHDGLAPCDVVECVREVKEHMAALQDPETNRRIGEAGRERLKHIMWSESNPADVEALRSFIKRNFS